MKRIFLILVILLIDFSISGCKSIFHVEFEDQTNQKSNESISNGLNVENRAVKQSSIELDLVNGGYRAVWEESYNYDTLILIDNLTDFTDFIKDHPPQSATEDVLKQDYNDEFFQQNVIYVYVKSEGSGSVQLNAKRAELEGDKLELFMERINAEEGTTDMATLVCIFGINRNDIKSIKSIEATILE